MKDKDKKKSNIPPSKFNTYWIYALMAIFLIGINIFDYSKTGTTEIDPGKFEWMIKEGAVEKLVIVNGESAKVFIKDKFLDKAGFEQAKKAERGPHFHFQVGSVDKLEELVAESQADLSPDVPKIRPSYSRQVDWIGPILSWVIPIFLIMGIWLLIMKRVSGGGGPGGQIFSIGKSKATLFDKTSKVTTTFKDVAGLQEAKVEVMEVVDFLKHPKKYTNLGGKIPKGVLLVGPPGTGKTLLAKAVAGEADVPFFSISGSDFVEMFVGVGASRVRDLFKQAREKAPCIVFIDEIDAIGRARGKNSMQGGNDERENTLNQLLVEMDGFNTDAGVILMAATNRPDVLDQALLRPGRFDRQIGVDPPDLEGRKEIFKVHVKNIKINDSIDPDVLAEMTPGFVGADIANICNEAALIAARNGKKKIDLDDFNYALDRVIGGLEKKSKIIHPKEKEIIAYHEAGHAICGWFLQHASPLVKVTIVPRGAGTLGYAQYLPKEEYIVRTEQLNDRMCMTMGGRAAEKIIFDKISTGAQSDLDQVTKMAYSMTTVYGMNEKVGQVSFYGMQQNSFSKPYSDETAALIDSEVRKMIDVQYDRAVALLKDKSKELDLLAKTLIEKEVLLKSDVEALVGPRPWDNSGEVFKKVETIADVDVNKLFDDEENNSKDIV